MKSRIRKLNGLSLDTWWNEGLRSLGERRGIPVPSNATPEAMRRWRDEIGMALIAEQPEFRLKGPGRPRGSKNRQTAKSFDARHAAWALRQRRYQQKKNQAKASQTVLHLVRIGDGVRDVLPLPEEVIAGLESFLICPDENSRAIVERGNQTMCRLDYLS
jgi:hypothetical protein